MLNSQITLVMLCFSIYVMLSFFYVYFKNKEEKNFFYAGLFFLSSSIYLLGLYFSELNISDRINLIFNKLIYVGIFGYFYTFPKFIFTIIEKNLNKKANHFLIFLTFLSYLLTFFTDLILKENLIKFGSSYRLEKGVLYPIFIFILLSISLYCTLMLLLYRRKLKLFSENYIPISITLIPTLFLAFVDIIGVIRAKPVIPFIKDPFLYGLFLFSLSIGYIFYSRYSWAINAVVISRREIEKLIEKRNKNFISLIQLIAKTLDAKDHYTAGHSMRVMEYALDIAEAFKLPENQKEILKQACLLHDIGKIGIPDGILNKNEKLTDDEFSFILKHPVISKEILETVEDFKDILEVVYHHHERVDGKGYPNGVKKENIPFLSRIITVADAYDAMRSERPYRKALSKEDAINELIKNKGTQFDEEIVERFIGIIKSKYSNEP